MQRSFVQSLVALFGLPVAENPTQAMMEAAFAYHGLDWRYLTIEVPPERLAAAVAGARALGFRGFHCTIPHKEAAAGLVDRLGRSAELIGAVNCVVREGDLLVGENTDGRGFVESLRRRVEPAGLGVALLGAGGAGRAIAVELALAGAARIVVVNRSSGRGRALVERLRRLPSPPRADYVPWDDPYTVDADVDLLVDATPIALYPDVDALPAVQVESLRADLIVADVVANPPVTPLLREAAARGCVTIGGLEMLAAQGELSFRYWTGVEPDVGVMQRALEEVFAAA